MASPAYKFLRTPEFRKSFDGLHKDRQKSAKDAFKIFKSNPFDARLRTHKINRLSALYKRTVFSVTVEGDLRAVFYIDGANVISLDIGTHDIYR